MMIIIITITAQITNRISATKEQLQSGPVLTLGQSHPVELPEELGISYNRLGRCRVVIVPTNNTNPTYPTVIAAKAYVRLQKEGNS